MSIKVLLRSASMERMDRIKQVLKKLEEEDPVINETEIEIPAGENKIMKVTIEIKEIERKLKLVESD